MPNKPIKQGYKIYGITDYRYIYDWIWSSREKGLQEMVLYLNLTIPSVLYKILHFFSYAITL